MNRAAPTPPIHPRTFGVELHSQQASRSEVLGKGTVQRVTLPCFAEVVLRSAVDTVSRALWDESAKHGGRLLLRLNTTPNAIADKYHEGKVESTLERELNVPATVSGEASGLLVWRGMCFRSLGAVVACYGLCACS